MLARKTPAARLLAILVTSALLLLFYVFTRDTIHQNLRMPSPAASGVTKDHHLDVTDPSSVTYSLDSECKFSLNDTLSQDRQREFNAIFETRRWSSTGSRSGPGSSLEGAFDWLNHLRSLMEHHAIRSIADIPCGDTFWQFSLREINTIEQLYFGGDISTSVVKQNQKLYQSTHRNKLFQYWDLVNCPVPSFSYRNGTQQVKANRFDLVIVRDALQHMQINRGLKAVRNVILSGAKFFALSTYPPNGQSSAANGRSIGKNDSLPDKPADCGKINYCRTGQIKDGDFYANNINCPPFNFPLNKAILVQKSHERFPHEHDEIHIYPIDDELRQIVAQYDKACA